MIAFLRFLEPNEIFLEFLFRVECDTIHALHLLAFLIAAPIGAGDARQTEAVRIDFARLPHMRAAAKIGEVRRSCRR